jgi:hypothetical protein
LKILSLHDEAIIKTIKWIYGTHDLELGRGSYDILKILQAAKPEVPV